MDKKNVITKIAIFQKKEIRKTIYKNEWWFVIIDVIYALTDSAQPDGYIKDMRRRDAELAKGWGQIATPLPVKTEGGLQRINCANTEGIFRIIQSIPSPKAKPFKRWLAKVSTTKIVKDRNALGFIENEVAAKKGGKIAGDARKKLELESGGKVVTKKNYLTIPQNRKRIK